MNITTNDLQSLGSKLDALVLSSGERAILHAMVDATLSNSPNEVAGFAFATSGPLSPRIMDFDWLVKTPVAKPLGGDDPGWIKAPGTTTP
ncbi:MAG: hypothetical protein GYA65_04500 [Actinobacteria bacterium]|jgi:hypothetical protein|nr:hypothetical protein [Acidimicrobiaceae bacterium]MBP9052692.1 hypothetical protein [Ilumatobacteraceae bacterium]NMD23427.1 hypothetical protein [Actinomycetota bacterium]HRC48062.1 hypothetical protein [Ilumatobacteraceae bacterium]